MSYERKIIKEAWWCSDGPSTLSELLRGIRVSNVAPHKSCWI